MINKIGSSPTSFGAIKLSRGQEQMLTELTSEGVSKKLARVNMALNPQLFPSVSFARMSLNGSREIAAVKGTDGDVKALVGIDIAAERKAAAALNLK